MYKKKLVTLGLSTAAVMSIITGCSRSVIPQGEVASYETVSGNEVKEVKESAEDMGKTALGKAEELAKLLPQEDLKNMLDTSDAMSDSAVKVQDCIGDYMKANPKITYAYLINYKDASKEAAQFLVNWEHTDEYYGDDFGDLYDEVTNALNGTPDYDKEPTSDKDGTVITGYAPVKDSDGNVIAVVCVDYAVPVEAADYIVVNAKIYTEDEAEPTAEAFAVRDGKFVYVGLDNTDALKALKGENTKVIDMQGKTITPSLIDAHTHVATPAMTAWCTEVYSEDKDELLQQIKEGAEANKDPYILFKCYPSDMFGKEGPRKEWLDEIDNTRPMAVSDFNDHSVWVNSKFLETLEKILAKHDLKLEDVGARKDKNGYTGLIEEVAWMDYMDEFYEEIGWKPPIDADEKLMSLVTNDLKKWGETGVFDAYIESEQQVKSVSDMDKAGKLNMYYDMAVKVPSYEELDASIAQVKEYQEKYGTEHVKIDTLKVFYDGTNELGTSMLVDGTVENPDYHGEDHMFADADQTYTMIKKANEAGVDIHFHLVGDLAFRQVCDAVEKLKGEIGELDIQVEMCHCEYVNPADRERPAKLGIILNWTPQWSGGYFGEGAKEHLGEERYNDMYNFNPMIESGATVTFGSDIYSWDEEQRANPYFGMQTAMTKVDIESPLEDENGKTKARESEDACLSLEDLLKGYTIDAAKQLRIDDVTGSISFGKAANYNVYDKDLFEVNKEEFKDVLPESVVFEGEEIDQN